MKLEVCCNIKIEQQHELNNDSNEFLLSVFCLVGNNFLVYLLLKAVLFQYVY